MKKAPRRAGRPKPKGAKRAAPKKARKIVIGNWKMNPQSAEAARETFREIKKAAGRHPELLTVICPPFIYLAELSKLAKGVAGVGVQDAHWEKGGAWTGEVSAEQAAGLGAEYCLVGHSERRAMGETDETVSRKIGAVLRADMKAVVCVGERERDQHGKFLETLAGQIKESLKGVSKRDLAQILIAYEPVWAIGKSDAEAMRGKDLHEMSLYIRRVLSETYGKDAAFSVPILYGGSVTHRNAREIVADGEVDGILAGRLSLEPDSFAEALSILSSI